MDAILDNDPSGNMNPGVFNFENILGSKNAAS